MTRFYNFCIQTMPCGHTELNDDPCKCLLDRMLDSFELGPLYAFFGAFHNHCLPESFAISQHLVSMCDC